MTVQELSQLYYLNREIEMDQKRLEELEAKIGPKAPQLTGMPHGSNNTDSITERLAAEMVDLQAIIAAKQLQCIHERARLERYIEGIDDSETRMMFTLRFINGLSWHQVARCMGDGYMGDSLKKKCYRYLKANKNERERLDETDEV